MHALVMGQRGGLSREVDEFRTGSRKTTTNMSRTFGQRIKADRAASKAWVSKFDSFDLSMLDTSKFEVYNV